MDGTSAPSLVLCCPRTDVNTSCWALLRFPSAEAWYRVSVPPGSAHAPLLTLPPGPSSLTSFPTLSLAAPCRPTSSLLLSPPGSSLRPPQVRTSVTRLGFYRFRFNAFSVPHNHTTAPIHKPQSLPSSDSSQLIEQQQQQKVLLP